MLYALGGFYAWSGHKQGPFFHLCRTQCDSLIGDGPQIIRFDAKFAFARIDLFISCFCEGFKKFEPLAQITYLIDHQHRRKNPLRFIIGEPFCEPLFDLLKSGKSGFCTCIATDEVLGSGQNNSVVSGQGEIHDHTGYAGSQVEDGEIVSLTYFSKVIDKFYLLGIV